MRFFTPLVYFIFMVLLSSVEGGIAVNSRTTLLFEASPGETFRSVIALSNSSDKSEEAKIYCSDYFFFADGSSRFDLPGSHAKSSCPWIKLSQNTVALPSKTAAEVSFSVTVPKNPELIGTYWGIIFVEPVISPFLPPSEAKLYRTIKSNTRYGIQVIIEIRKTGNYSVKVVKHEVTQEQDKKFFQVDVENLGTRFVQLKPSLDVFTSQGKKVKEITASKKMVFTNCSVRFSFDITSLESGDYMGFLLLDHSEEAMFGGQYPFIVVKTETEVDPKTEADLKAEAKAKTDSDPKTEADLKAEAKAKTEADPETEAKAKTETDPKTEAEVKAEADLETEADLKVEADPKTEAKAKTEADPETEADLKAEAKAKTEADPETEADLKAEAKAKTEAKAKREAKAKTEADPETEADLKAEADRKIELEKTEQ